MNTSCTQPETSTTAQSIFDTAPLGSIIRFSDSTPKPPARFTKKLANWERYNGTGQLVSKKPQHSGSTYKASAYFTLHTGDFGTNGVLVLKTFQSFTVDSAQQFQVISTPRPGSIRILNDWNGESELLHLAAGVEEAHIWLTSNSYTNARLEPCEGALA